MDTIAYSVELKRPGCVLLQAALGCAPAVAYPFPTETWIVGEGAETLRVYPLAPGQLERLVQITIDAWKDRQTADETGVDDG